jgi:ATP-binding cassette subfamily A (ABC1) protein 3
LLTTHFLDEADVLSDEIAIMSKGVLKARGSAVELKHTLGGGYRVFVTGTDFKPESQFADVPSYLDYDQTVYQLSDSSEVSRFIASIERDGDYQYRVQSPNMETVFLNLVDELRDDFGGSAVFAKGPAQPVIGSSKSNDESKSSESDSKEPALDLRPGYGTGWLRQAWVLFCKRWTVLRHNYLPYLAAVIIPIIAGGLTTRFLKGFDGLGCSPTAQISVQASYDINSQLDIDLVYGPPSAVPVEALSLLIPNLNASSLHAVNTLVEFNQYIAANFANVTPGGFFLGETPTFAYLANYQVSTAALVATIVDNLLSGTTISTQYQSFAIPFSPSAGDTLQLTLYFGLAMAVYPGFFALYPTAERLRNVRALHYSNGVRSAPLWSAYVLFDFIFVMLVSVIVTVLFAALWGHWYHIGYLFIVMFLYGLTAIAFSCK